MDSNNQFVVDLGTLKLDDAHRERISAAIQKAVTAELANAGDKNIHFKPVTAADKFQGIHGPLIRGFVAINQKIGTIER